MTIKAGKAMAETTAAATTPPATPVFNSGVVDGSADGSADGSGVVGTSVVVGSIPAQSQFGD